MTSTTRSHDRLEISLAFILILAATILYTFVFTPFPHGGETAIFSAHTYLMKEIPWYPFIAGNTEPTGNHGHFTPLVFYFLYPIFNTFEQTPNVLKGIFFCTFFSSFAALYLFLSYLFGNRRFAIGLSLIAMLAPFHLAILENGYGSIFPIFPIFPILILSLGYLWRALESQQIRPLILSAVFALITAFYYEYFLGILLILPISIVTLGTKQRRKQLLDIGIALTPGIIYVASRKVLPTLPFQELINQSLIYPEKNYLNAVGFTLSHLVDYAERARLLFLYHLFPNLFGITNSRGSVQDLRSISPAIDSIWTIGIASASTIIYLQLASFIHRLKGEHLPSRRPLAFIYISTVSFGLPYIFVQSAGLLDAIRYKYGSLIFLWILLGYFAFSELSMLRQNVRILRKLLSVSISLCLLFAYVGFTFILNYRTIEDRHFSNPPRAKQISANIVEKLMSEGALGQNAAFVFEGIVPKPDDLACFVSHMFWRNQTSIISVVKPLVVDLAAVVPWFGRPIPLGNHHSVAFLTDSSQLQSGIYDTVYHVHTSPDGTPSVTVQKPPL